MKSAVLPALSGVAIALLIMLAAAWWSQHWNGSVVLSHVRIEASVIRGASGGRVLQVHFSGQHDEQCPDVVDHILEGPDARDWPLKITNNMLTELDRDHPSWQYFEIPRDLPAGRYDYIGRATDLCPVFPGLIHPSPRRTLPVAVVVPPPNE